MSPPGASGEAPETHEKISSCTTRATSRPASPSCSTASTRRWPTSSSPWPTSTARGGGSSSATPASSTSCTESWDSRRAPPSTGRPPPNSSSAIRRSSSLSGRASSASRAWWSSRRSSPPRTGARWSPASSTPRRGRPRRSRRSCGRPEAAPHRDVVTVPQLAAPAKAVTRLGGGDLARDAGCRGSTGRTARRGPRRPTASTAACASLGRQARRGRAAHRRPAPVPHHRVQALPRQAGRGSRCAVAQPSRSVVPVARGGASTIANLRVTCRFHNQHAARQAFGDAWMDQFTARPLPGPAQEPDSPVAEPRCDES